MLGLKDKLMSFIKEYKPTMNPVFFYNKIQLECKTDDENELVEYLIPRFYDVDSGLIKEKFINKN